MIKKYSLQDLTIGQTLDFKKHFTSDLVKTFSHLTGDNHPLHCDEEYSRQNGFNGTIVQGFFLISFMSYAVGMELPGLNALVVSQESKFLKPVYIDEHVVYQCQIKQIETRFSMIDVAYSILNASGQLCATGTIKVKVRG